MTSVIKTHIKKWGHKPDKVQFPYKANWMSSCCLCSALHQLQCLSAFSCIDQMGLVGLMSYPLTAPE